MLGGEQTPALGGEQTPILVHEGRGSCVFAVGELAYKIHKPIASSGLDCSTLSRRRMACLAELRVNQDLAPGLHLAVKAIVNTPDGFRLAAADAHGAVEYAVQMRRFDERLTLAAMVDADALTPAAIQAVARRLAAFHNRATVASGGASAAAVLERWRASIAELHELGAPEDWHLDVLGDFGEAFVRAHSREIERRARDRHVRDGHGDLLCEHVLVDDHVRVIGRLAHPAQRAMDVAADLASLTMDLEARGQGWAAAELVSAYRKAGGSPGSEALRAFHAAHHALVGACLELVWAREEEAEAADERTERAEHLHLLAERLCWRARRPLVIIACGLPSSGRSTLAAELAERSQMGIVSATEVGRRQAAAPTRVREGAAERVGAAEQASAKLGRATYDLLSRDALARLHGSGGVIVDASCSGRAERGRLIRRLDLRAVTRLVVRCGASLDGSRSRAGLRVADGSRAGSVQPIAAEQHGSGFEPFDELPADSVLELDTRRPLDEQVAELTRAVDRRLSLGNRYGSGVRPAWRLLHSQSPWPQAR